MKRKKFRDIISFAALLLIVTAVNIWSQDNFWRWDLTADNRYTLSDASKKILRKLEQPVHIKIYLEGSFSPALKRLQISAKELLTEFHVYSDEQVTYELVRLSKIEKKRKRNLTYRKLLKNGIRPTTITVRKQGERKEKRVFPGAILQSGNKTDGVMLLKGSRSAGMKQQVNQSIENLEYGFISGIKKLTIKDKKNVAFLRGHGELPRKNLADIGQSMKDYYNVSFLNLDTVSDISGRYDMVISAKPERKFSKADKYKLDQYMVRGGKTMFLVDMIDIDLDSIGVKGAYGMPYDIGLQSFLFNYGVRLNYEVVQDAQCWYLRMQTGYKGNQPKYEMMKWKYYPLIFNYSNHPITRNLDATWMRFAGTMDTVLSPGIKKTPLFFTSRRARIFETPVPLSLNEARVEATPRLFNDGPEPLAYLLEGKFQSAFKARPVPDLPGLKKKVKADKAGKMLVCTDGDIIKNEVDPRNGRPYKLGLDPDTKQEFANKEFLMNAMSYMLNEGGVIKARAKTISMRPLNEFKVDKYRVLVQVLNLLAPVVLIILFAVLRYYVRKVEYEKRVFK